MFERVVAENEWKTPVTIIHGDFKVSSPTHAHTQTYVFSMKKTAEQLQELKCCCLCVVFVTLG